MDWLKEHEQEAVDVYGRTMGAGGSVKDALRAVMVLGVEKAAARAGTMVAARLRIFNARILADGLSKTEQAELLGHAEAQGATVATLQAKVEELERQVASREKRWAETSSERSALRAEVDGVRSALTDIDHGGLGREDVIGRIDRLKALLRHARAEVERLKGLLDLAQRKTLQDTERIAALESRATALDRDSADAMENWRLAQKRETEERVARKAAESRLAVIRDRRGEAMHRALNLTTMLEKAYADRVRTWVLEGDAPQEAGELVEVATLTHGMVGQPKTTEVFVRYPCSPTCTHDDAANPGHPERVKERSEAVNRDLDDSITRDALMGDGYEKGAEAMRAACWEALQPFMDKHGFSPSEREEAKAAIEGAAP